MLQSGDDTVMVLPVPDSHYKPVRPGSLQHLIEIAKGLIVASDILFAVIHSSGLCITQNHQFDVMSVVIDKAPSVLTFTPDTETHHSNTHLPGLTFHWF